MVDVGSCAWVKALGPKARREVLAAWQEYSRVCAEAGGKDVLIPVALVRRLLRCSRQAVSYLIGRGMLVAVRREKRVFVRGESVEHHCPEKRAWAPSLARVWTAAEDALLGTVPDAELGRRLGVSNTLVRERRLKLGIAPPFPRPRHLWTKKEDGLLGKASDGKLAQRLGLTRAMVTHRRRLLGIASASGMPAPKHVWTALEDAIVGTASDAKVAARLGLLVTHVRSRRVTLGLDSFRWRSYRESLTDVLVLARKAGTRRDKVSWTPEEDALLGHLTDLSVGCKLGVSAAAVRRRRAELGIGTLWRQRSAERA